MTSAARVHIPSGHRRSGRKVISVCSCGHVTTPRVDARRATAALLREHGYTDTVCALCGRNRWISGVDDEHRHDHLRIATDPETGDQFLACRDDEQTCAEIAERRQMQAHRSPSAGLVDQGTSRLRMVRSAPAGRAAPDGPSAAL